MSSKRKQRSNQKNAANQDRQEKEVKAVNNFLPAVKWAGFFISAALFFFAVCLCSPSSIKPATVALEAVLLITGYLCFSSLRDSVSMPLLVLAAVVVMDGLSISYARSGKFALYEFLKVFSALLMVLSLLAVAPKKNKARFIAGVLSMYSALAGIVSVDLISTRFLSNAVTALLGFFTPDYANLSGVEDGVRMTSFFGNPNVFAGCIGIGVLLSLGLAATASNKTERRFFTALLFINSLSFMMAFSMGATLMIALAFIVWLLLEKENIGLFVLMLETLLITLISAGLVSATALHTWNSVQPVPLVCLSTGAVLLCLLDEKAGNKLAEKLQGKKVPLMMASVAAVMAVLCVLAYNFTGAAELEAGKPLTRSAYPEPGTYTLKVESDAEVNVEIESQNREQAMMHTNTSLYTGSANGVSFTVPEDSIVTHFRFSSATPVKLEAASCEGDGGPVKIPLGYKLLPSFIANRLQGLFANQNAIQRFVFFHDGLKLFKENPVFGLGMGAYENGVKSVQTFYYETKYAHNHYIQALAETGLIGLVLFLGLLAVSAFAVISARKKENADPLIPALGAALVFMAGHAAVEVVFSSYAYLPIAFGTFALIGLCCKGAFPEIAKNVKNGFVAATSALTVAFCVLLVRNMMAANLINKERSVYVVPKAVSLDCFEWADHMLSYVTSTMNVAVDSGIRNQADEYAERLAELNSNTIPLSLAEYYFNTDRPENAIRMLEKYVGYVSSDQEAWRNVFNLLMQFEQPSESYREGVIKLGQMLEDWNAQNMGGITLDETEQAFLDKVRAG